MPIPDDFHVEVCDWQSTADRAALLGVRATVFIEEQHVPADIERDDDDARAVHLLARTPAGDPVGTGRLLVDPAPGDGHSTGRTGHIGRMAVLSAWRRRGVGSTLLHGLLDHARARGVREICLHAQHTAIAFYQRHGFTARGAEFEEAGIPHVEMTLQLTPLAAPERPALAPAPAAVILRAATREELIDVTRTLLAGAKHSICILVRELHPQLLDDTACLVELRRLAVSGRGASIRIVAQDLSRALEEGTRVLELAQRVSSVVQLRRPLEPADQKYASAFMCTDTQGYLFRPVEGDMMATGSTYAPGRHAELTRLFEGIWERSEPWPELRILGI
ncbi:MAG: GNAT family N-acetyltransferase [Rhodanobacteraceae bacterium]|nr:MAG: GNAT family N-acetyltransferase [Rhodanobacteraceae bacterium]